LALRIFLAIVVGIVGQIDAREVRRIGFRHLLGAVAQAHDRVAGPSISGSVIGK
jgi:hypothetical protein